MRDLLERTASRHLMSAEMHEMLAARMESWLEGANIGGQPVLMAGIAAQLGTASAVATLGRQGRTPAMVATSDKTAQAAHDLEVIMGEGPAVDAANGTLVNAVGTTLLDQWPRYGPAVAELGIQAVCAAPLGPARTRIGTLCAYDRVPQAPQRIATATKLMADALTQMVLGLSESAEPPTDLAVLGFLDLADSQSVVQQAIGMVSVQFGCQPEDAADLLAARAFAESTPLLEVARQVVSGEVRLG